MGTSNNIYGVRGIPASHPDSGDIAHFEYGGGTAHSEYNGGTTQSAWGGFDKKRIQRLAYESMYGT